MTGGAIENAKVDWVGAAPRSIFFGDVYFSGDGPAEARHVFVEGSGLADLCSAGGDIRVGELGFGTGLNLLVAWEAFDRLAPSDARLQLFSIERHPLPPAALERAHAAWPELATRAVRLRAAMPPHAPGFHHRYLSERISLTLAFGDAADILREADGRFDAFFLDGFAPSKNPDMWSATIFAELARLMRPGARAATFTVAGAVRRGLAEAGFHIAKRPGFGAKREMLVATRGDATSAGLHAPWFAPPHFTISPRSRVAIIGGGVAGAAMAQSLMRRGFSPLIVEAAGLAAGASGNPAGLISPRLDADASPLSRFHRAAFLHALHRLDHHGADDSVFLPCGVLMTPRDDEDRARFAKLVALQALPPSHLELRGDALFLPPAGVVDAPRYVRALAGDVDCFNARVLHIETHLPHTRLVTDRGVIDADAVVIANGADARRFAQTRAMALEATAGQVNWYPAATPLTHAVANGPYAAPAPAGGVVIGATYGRGAGDVDPPVDDRATDENLRRLCALDPALAANLSALSSTPRAARRAVTPDRAPLIGAAPDIDGYGAIFDDLRYGRARDWPAAPYLPRIFVLSGFGSRGLTTAPLAAEMLAALISGAPSPVERSVSEALHPARFFIRDLKRARIVRAK
jgi:tRNA 5-methylaminomethyl-2-thiouridine biosynthesis bifunctional protein